MDGKTQDKNSNKILKTMDRFNFFQKAVLAYISNPKIAEQAQGYNYSLESYSIKLARDLVKLMDAEATNFEDDNHDYYYGANDILERIADNIEYLWRTIEENETQQQKEKEPKRKTMRNA